MAFLEENGEAREAIEALWAEVLHLRSAHILVLNVASDVDSTGYEITSLRRVGIAYTQMYR